MPDFVRKSSVKEYSEMNVGRDFYNKLNKRLEEIISRAEERASANGRKTVKARDA